eukprot:CAMPEP_0171932450 /NCGR_PEP_ID=MMETSP0993-20121228/30390_1 /TAXON_ID=483369 /ORGANISM="non described non described, Strain CCMP2098" /LENGTH=300 /DNA_ID=CAMNT_0012572745 /DNA_START=59 /DNA_END=961 /DNA_ORIENTATION=-
MLACGPPHFIFIILVLCCITSNCEAFTHRHGISRVTTISSSRKHSKPIHLLETLLRRFDGDFDNYQQLLADRKAGLEPREGGGHEHIHCTLSRLTTAPDHDRRPVRSESPNVIIALYYFNGDPGKIFRARCYTLHSSCPEEQQIEMRLWKLPACVTVAASNAGATGGSNAAVAAVISELAAFGGLVEHDELKGCEVFWSLATGSQDGKEGADPSNRLLAHMEGGGCCVESERSPGTMIRVEDELVLWDNELWINDRGFDVETGAFLYGNQRGVPYKMVRVVEEESNGLLSWTLGGDHKPR